MLLKKFLPTIPSFRFKNKIKYMHKFRLPLSRNSFIYKNIANTNNNGNHAVKHVKFFFKKKLYMFNCINRFYSSFIVKNYYNNHKPNQEFVVLQNIYNQTMLLPSINLFYPGFKLYPMLHILEFYSSKFLIGQLVPIYLIPLNMPISRIYSSFTNKSAYACSSGMGGVRKKLLRKSKNITVSLPSGLHKHFPFLTKCFLGSNSNFFFNKLIEGSWGNSLQYKKHIAVRGVAKNPVDHPNGGRTKTKQPELSPWGWVAKINK